MTLIHPNPHVAKSDPGTPMLNVNPVDDYFVNLEAGAENVYRHLQNKSIGGWLDRAEAIQLYKWATQAHIIIEVGCYKGRSTFMLCSATPGVVFTIDPWQPEPEGLKGGHYSDLANPIQRKEVIDGVRSKLSTFLQAGKLFIMEMSSKGGFINLAIGPLRYVRPDMMFIDGDHSGSAVRLDIQAAIEFVRPGGLICGHDYKPGEMQGLCDAVDSLLPQRSLVPGTSLWYAFQSPAIE